MIAFSSQFTRATDVFKVPFDYDHTFPVSYIQSIELTLLQSSPSDFGALFSSVSLDAVKHLSECSVN